MKKEILPLVDDLTEEPTPQQIKSTQFWYDAILPKKCHDKIWKCIYKPGSDFHCQCCEKYF
jgi:hypothetical protein